MANKQYTSIIRLFNYCDISTGQDFNLLRAKKQLQAEFGIAQDGFIEVNGYTYTRHDVFEEIEQPDFLRRLAFHKEIWNIPQVLHLLEDNLFNAATIQEGFRNFYNNTEFDEFLSPYFVGPFNYVSRNLLADASLAEMGELLRVEGLLQAPEREEAFRPLRIFLDETLRLLRNTNRENYKVMRSKLSHWIDTEWYGFFNNLPDEFYDIKIDLVVRLINLGVAVQKKHRRDCRKISKQLVALEEIPENHRATILSNHRVYSGSSYSFRFRGSFWVVWIIIGVIRGLTSEGCEHKSNDYQEFQNTPLNKYQKDSIVRMLKSNSKPIIIDSSILRKLPRQELH